MKLAEQTRVNVLYDTVQTAVIHSLVVEGGSLFGDELQEAIREVADAWNELDKAMSETGVIPSNWKK